MGRWVARCPAHNDRHPSLRIRRGKHAVLLKCWAGCPLGDILQALGLSTRDLFPGDALTPAQRRQAAEERARLAAAALANSAEERRRADDFRKLDALVSFLGHKLALLPDDHPAGGATAWLFHRACDRLHGADEALGMPEDGPQRLSQPEVKASWIADALALAFKDAPRARRTDGPPLGELERWENHLGKEKATPASVA